MDFGLLPPAIKLRDHLVLCDADRLRVFNPTARRIWDICRETGDPARAVAWLIDAYGLSRAQAEQDVRALLAPPIADDPPPVPAVSPRPSGRLFPQTTGACEARYSLYDRPFSLRCTTEPLARALKPLFAHLLQHAPTAAGPRFTVDADATGYTGWRDQTGLFETTALDDAVIGLLAAVLEYAVEERNLTALLHAGAVSDGNTCLVLSGAGGSGKSTLTAALLSRGYRYLSDDLVPLEYGGGHALPVPVCLNLKAGSIPVLAGLYPDLPKRPTWRSGQRQLRFLPPPAFAQRPPERPYRVAAIVFPEYRPSAAPGLEPLDPVTTLTRLIRSDTRFDLPLNPAKIAALCAWIEATPAYDLRYGDLTAALDTLAPIWP